MKEPMSAEPAAVQIAPWLSVADATKAVDYYKRAFGAVEAERLEDEPGNCLAEGCLSRVYLAR